MSAIRSARRPKRRSLPIGRILLLGFFLVFVLLPLYWMFNTSIKPSDDYLAIPPVWFPAQPTLVHYEAALFAYRGLEGLINSLIISLAATILSALFGTLMAYSLARYNTGGQHLSFWVLSQRFLPPIGASRRSSVSTPASSRASSNRSSTSRPRALTCRCSSGT